MFGLSYGTHALSAKMDHGIKDKQITDTWFFGEPVKGKRKCWRLIGEEITLVLNKSGDFIVTMYPNKYGDMEIAESVKRRRLEGANNSIPPNARILEMKGK
jgi:hypothetical protein